MKRRKEVTFWLIRSVVDGQRHYTYKGSDSPVQLMEASPDRTLALSRIDKLSVALRRTCDVTVLFRDEHGKEVPLHTAFAAGEV